MNPEPTDQRSNLEERVLGLRIAREHIERARRSVYVEPLPKFPIDTLPPDVGAYVRASASSARVPVEMVAVPFLAFVGSTIGNQLRFDVGNGWTERPVLWIALIATTGAGKTPGLTAARQPLDILQDEAWSAWQHRMRKWQVLSEPRPAEPAFDRFFTTDPTMEALVEDLQHAPGIVVVRDELIGIVRAMNQYRARGGDDRQKYLSLWSSHPLAPSRKSVSSAYIRNPVVSVVGGIQPLLWNKLRSKEQDGFIERFLPLVLGIPRRYWNESSAAESPPPDVTAMVDRFRHLRDIPSAGEHGDGLLLARTAEAGALWGIWYNENVDRALAGSLVISGYYQKLPAHVARLALILHSLWHPGDLESPVSAATMTHAIALGEFFRSHIHRSLALLGETVQTPPPKPTLAERILRLLSETSEPEGWVSRNEIYARLAPPSRADLSAALQTLIEQRHIEGRKQRIPTSRRPVEQYRAT